MRGRLKPMPTFFATRVEADQVQIKTCARANARAAESALARMWGRMAAPV